jgi:PqqD family protein of HPr-rel-A system
MIYKCWDNQCIVFHPESGNTHLLTQVFCTILEHLRVDESDDNIAALILAERSAPDHATAIEWIQSARQEFDRLGLLP